MLVQNNGEFFGTIGSFAGKSLGQRSKARNIEEENRSPTIVLIGILREEKEVSDARISRKTIGGVNRVSSSKETPSVVFASAESAI